MIDLYLKEECAARSPGRSARRIRQPEARDCALAVGPIQLVDKIA